MKNPNFNKKDRVISPWTILRRNWKLGENCTENEINKTEKSNISQENLSHPKLKQDIGENFKNSKQPKGF